MMKRQFWFYFYHIPVGWKMSMIIKLSQMRKYEVKPILGPFTSKYEVAQNHI